MNVKMSAIRKITDKQALKSIVVHLTKSRAQSQTAVDLRDRKIAVANQRIAEL